MKEVIVCEPIKESILYGNMDLEYNLFGSYVHYQKALEQHQNLQSVLKQHGYSVVKINKYIPTYIPIKEYTNLMFVRDSFIVTKKGIVLGQMSQPVRKFECKLMDTLLKQFNKPILYSMEVPETMEGGDFVFFEDISFIACSLRTSISAIQKMLDLRLFGTSKVAVIYTEEPDKDMARIHLDCYFAPFGDRYCILWEELIRVNSKYQRYVMEYRLNDLGHYKKTIESMPLFEYLIQTHFNVIPISDKAQRNYGCNILELEDGTILTQEEESTRKIKNSVFVPMDEIHKMYGGIHCVTNVLS